MLPMPDLPARLSILALSLLLAGCMTTRVEETKNAATGLAADESIVILASSYHRGNETELGFVECVEDRVQSGRAKLDVQSQDAFLDAMFPWFEPRTAPQGVEDLPKLLERPGVAERIQETGVRYVVWVRGDTDVTDRAGGLSCAVGPGGGGCFGLAWWENESSYKAAVWDMRRAISAGEVTTDVAGTSVMPAVVLPVPLIARTQAAACKGLARQLQTFIGGDSDS